VTVRSVPGRTPRIDPDTWRGDRMTAEELEAIRENAREYVALWRRDYGPPGEPRWEA
jgi:hypothetical protein